MEEALYEAYNATAPCWPLIGWALALNSVGVAGILANFSVVWVTIRDNTLHGTANFLLALYSFFELLHQHGHLVFAWTALSGRNFIRYDLATYIWALPLFGFGLVGMPLVMAFTGLDRLLAVLFPVFWGLRMQKPAPYALLSTLCIAYPTWMMWNFFTALPNTPVPGTLVDILGANPNHWLLTFNQHFAMDCYYATVAFYVAIGVVLSCRKGPNSNVTVERQKRLLRALSAIIAVNLGGYIVTTAFLMYWAGSIASPLALWFAIQPFSLLANISAASNGPILYWTSKDYKKAFQAEFNRLKSALCCAPNAVQPFAAGGRIVVMRGNNNAQPMGSNEQQPEMRVRTQTH